ncbi:uncharacterized protein LOC144451819 [Glandiceps talaboti]
MCIKLNVEYADVIILRQDIKSKIAILEEKFQKKLEIEKQHRSQEECEKMVTVHREEMQQFKFELEKVADSEKLLVVVKSQTKKREMKYTENEHMELYYCFQMDVMLYDIANEDIEQGTTILVKEFRQAIEVSQPQLSEVEVQTLVKSYELQLQALAMELVTEVEQEKLMFAVKVQMEKKHSKRTKEEGSEADEVHDLKEQITRKRNQFKEEMKKKRSQLSDDEYQRLLVQHEKDVEKLTRKLERSKEQQRLALIQKLANRKRKKHLPKNEEDERAKVLIALRNKEVLTIRELNLLEVMIEEYNVELQDELQQLSRTSPEKYERLLAQHERNTERLAIQLQQEREKSEEFLSDEEKISDGEETDGDDGEFETVAESLTEQIKMAKIKFQEEVEKKRSELSEDDYQRLLAEHEKEMDRLTKTLDRNKERQRLALLEKLANRKRRRKLKSNEEEERAKLLTALKNRDVLTEEQLKLLQAEIEEYEVDYEDELKQMAEVSPGEYEGSMAQHKKTIEELVNKLEEEKKKAEKDGETNLVGKKSQKDQTDSSDDGEFETVEESLTEQIKMAKIKFQEEVEKKRSELSEDDYQRLLAEHEKEMERLTKTLDRNKERQRLALLEKLANRKRRRKLKSNEEEERAKLLTALKNKDVLTEEQLKLLKAEIEEYEVDYNDELQHMAKVSPGEYEGSMAQHKKTIEQLVQKLEEEKMKAEKDGETSLVGKKSQKDQTDSSDDSEFVTVEESLTEQIKMAKIKFQEEVEKKRSELSEDDYQRLLAEHEKDMERLTKTLDRNKERQRLALLEKLANRKRRRKLKSNEEEERAKLLTALKNRDVLTEEQLKLLQAEIEEYEVDYTDELQQMAEVSPGEYEGSMAQHKKIIEKLVQKLEEEKKKAEKDGETNLVEKKSQKDQTDSQRDETDEAEVLSAKIARIEKKLKHTKKKFKEAMKTKRSEASEEECQRLLEEHEKDVKRLTRKLTKQKEKQRLVLMERLARRRRMRNAKTNEEDDMTQLLQALKNKETLTEEQLKMLEEELELYSNECKKDLEQKSSQISPEEYQRLVAQHDKDVEEMKTICQEQKDKANSDTQENSPKTKTSILKRRSKVGPEPMDENDTKTDDVDDDEISRREAQFEEERKRQKKALSKEDYKSFLQKHKRQMAQLLKEKEHDANRQKLALQEKLDKKRKRRAALRAEREQTGLFLNTDNVKQEDINAGMSYRNQEYEKTLSQRKPGLTEAEYQTLIDENNQQTRQLGKQLQMSLSRRKLTSNEKIGLLREKRHSVISNSVRGRSNLSQDEIELRDIEREIADDITRKEEEIEMVEHQRQLQQLSEEDYQTLITRLKPELELLTLELDNDDTVEGLLLSTKLDIRRRKRVSFIDGSMMSSRRAISTMSSIGGRSGSMRSPFDSIIRVHGEDMDLFLQDRKTRMELEKVDLERKIHTRRAMRDGQTPEPGENLHKFEQVHKGGSGRDMIDFSSGDESDGLY